jgi:hypothetical protein
LLGTERHDSKRCEHFLKVLVLRLGRGGRQRLYSFLCPILGLKKLFA